MKPSLFFNSEVKTPCKKEGAGNNPFQWFPIQSSPLRKILLEKFILKKNGHKIPIGRRLPRGSRQFSAGYIVNLHVVGKGISFPTKGNLSLVWMDTNSFLKIYVKLSLFIDISWKNSIILRVILRLFVKFCYILVRFNTSFLALSVTKSLQLNN